MDEMEPEMAKDEMADVEDEAEEDVEMMADGTTSSASILSVSALASFIASIVAYGL